MCTRLDLKVDQNARARQRRSNCLPRYNVQQHSMAALGQKQRFKSKRFRNHSGYGHIGVLVSTAITRRVLCKQDHAVRCFKDFRRAAFVDENRRAGLKRDTGKAQSSRFAGSYVPPIGEPSYPPPPGAGVRAATGPTMRSKSALGPGLPWIGTCCATSSFSRLTFLNSATALKLTFASVPPAGGGP